MEVDSQLKGLTSADVRHEGSGLEAHALKFPNGMGDTARYIRSRGLGKKATAEEEGGSKQADDESLSTQTQEESWIAKDGGATSGRGACEKRKNETNGRDSQNNGEKAKAKPGSKSNAADVTKKQETINKQEKEHLNTTLNKQFQVHTHSSLKKDEDTHTRRARAYY